MEYLALDIETGGLDFAHSVIEVGMVVCDTHTGHPGSARCARIVVISDGGYICDPWAALHHARLWKETMEVRNSEWWQETVAHGHTYAAVRPGEPESHSEYLTIYVRQGYEYQAMCEALDRIDMDRRKSIIVGGKNVARFDLPRLEAHGFLFPVNPETGEPLEPGGIGGGSMTPIRFKHRCLDPCMLWLEADDEEPPDLDTCLKRAGIDCEVPHDAVDDAKLAAKCITAGLTRE